MAQFDRSDTYAKIVEIAAEKLNIDKTTITEQSTFQDLGADSLDMVEFFMRLEELFGIEVKDNDVEQLQNVGQVVDYVHHLRTR